MSSTNMSNPLSVLVVGCGDIAGGYDEWEGNEAVKTHAGAYSQDSRFSLKACVEPNAERRKAFMSHWHVDRGYEDLEECLAYEGPFDVVSVCVPTEFHADTLEKLLPARPGCVFCEKPLTGNLKETRYLVEAYEAAGVPMAVNYFRRWDPRIVALRDELASGTWGRIQAINGLYAKGLFNSGSHFFDMVHFLFGGLVPIKVLGQVDDGRIEDPTLSVFLQNETGLPVILVGTNYRFFYPFEIDLVLEFGRISIEDLGGQLRLRKVRPHPKYLHQQALDAGTWESTEMGSAMLRALDNIFGHLSTGTPITSNGRSALDVEELCSEIMAIKNEGESR